jgi:cytochrome b
MASDPSGRPVYVLVWDVPIRLFHWSIVILVAVSWFSADQGYMRVHLWSGSALLVLLLFRLAWGFAGSTTARFASFLYPLPRVMGYLRGLLRGDRLLYAGHNPAGGLMVMALIAVLLAQAVTGLFASDGVRFTAPLALLVSEEMSLRITGWHGLIFNLILVLVWCHLVAVGFYLLVKGDNLVRPMLTGRKPHSHVPHGTALRFTHPLIALLVLAVMAGLVALLVFRGN